MTPAPNDKPTCQTCHHHNRKLDCCTSENTCVDKSLWEAKRKPAPDLEALVTSELNECKAEIARLRAENLKLRNKA